MRTKRFALLIDDGDIERVKILVCFVIMIWSCLNACSSEDESICCSSAAHSHNKIISYYLIAAVLCLDVVGVLAWLAFLQGPCLRASRCSRNACLWHEVGLKKGQRAKGDGRDVVISVCCSHFNSKRLIDNSWRGNANARKAGKQGAVVWL